MHVSIVLPIAIWRKEIKQKPIRTSGLKLSGQDVQQLFALNLRCTAHARRVLELAHHLQIEKMLSQEPERILSL